MINNWLYSPRKLGVLPTNLPSCFFDILSWRPQNSTNLITCLSRVLFWSMIFFSTVGKQSHVHVSFIFAKFNKHIKLICANLIFFRFFPIFVSWFYQHTKGLSWQHQVQTHATHHLQSDPSWISLQANHLNSFNHCIWKRRFLKPVCNTRKSYENKGVQVFNNKVIPSRYKIFQYSENSRAHFVFQGKRKLFKNPEW